MALNQTSTEAIEQRLRDLKWIKTPGSTNVERFAYMQDLRVLLVEYANKAIYGYPEVPWDHYDNLLIIAVHQLHRCPRTKLLGDCADQDLVNKRSEWTIGTYISNVVQTRYAGYKLVLPAELNVTRPSIESMLKVSLEIWLPIWLKGHS